MVGKTQQKQFEINKITAAKELMNTFKNYDEKIIPAFLYWQQKQDPRSESHAQHQHWSKVHERRIYL